MRVVRLLKRTVLFGLLEAGDHVIVHWPCYQSLHEVARSIGCEVTRWEAREENGWALDLDELRAHDAILLGAIGDPTVPPGVLRKLADHPLTDRGLEIFLADWDHAAAMAALAQSPPRPDTK